jgi:DNA-binding XRE family transcriptional regulator
MPKRAAMRSLPSPWLARSTILARMTSRYGDVYSLDRASSSACSSLVSSIAKGLRLDVPHPPRRGCFDHAVPSRHKNTSPYLGNGVLSTGSERWTRGSGAEGFAATVPVNTRPAARPLRAVRDARIKRRLSVAEVAEQVGVTQSSIYFWETDHCRPRAASLSALCKVLKLPVRATREMAAAG